MAGSAMREYCYILGPDNEIVDVDGEWVAFAEENDAPELTKESVVGRSVFDFIHGFELWWLYGALYGNVRNGSVIRLPFRCDAPGRRREMEMDLRPLNAGYISVCSRETHVDQRDYAALLDRRQVRCDEIVPMCSWCKRIRIGESPWQEVEDAASGHDLFSGAALPMLDHVLCMDCRRTLFPKVQV